jgi:class 3 adenylate cyclase
VHRFEGTVNQYTGDGIMALFGAPIAHFDLHDLDRFHVKGVREPPGVYQLRGVGRLRTRLERSRARGFSHFVGCIDEMATLQAALDRAVAGQGQVGASGAPTPWRDWER